MSDLKQPDKEKSLSSNKESQINVVVNRSGEDDVIDFLRIFHNMKGTLRVYIWAILLCVVLGVCVPLLLHQFGKTDTGVASVVTLDYDVEKILEDEDEPVLGPVDDLTAPDGTDIDLSQITSAYVLQNALSGLILSEPIEISKLRDNIHVERILTEESRRQQEVAAKMLEDRNAGAYEELQNVELTYINQFIVSLDNGFGTEDGRKVYLPDEELSILLNRVLASYNGYLALTYADFRLPGDAISIIDTKNLDIMESLDLLRAALDDLYQYCDKQTDEVKEYRSHRDGLSLNDLMRTLQTAREVNVEYLYSHVYANSIAVDRAEMLGQYRYLLREAQTKLDVVNENIRATEDLLKTYQYDRISVENPDSGVSSAKKITTDYYNKLVLQQAANYEEAAALEISIDELNTKIANLQTSISISDTIQAKNELTKAISVCSSIYQSICEQMEEIMDAPFYTTYADATAAQGQATPSFLSANMKKMILGALVGAVLGCGLWFGAAFIAEMKRGKNKKTEEEVQA